MSISQDELKNLVELSMDGEYNRHSIDQFCQNYPDINEEEAYRGQALRLQLMEAKGYKLVGYKMGGTSLAKRKQLESTIYSAGRKKTATTRLPFGRLMDYMQLKPEEDLCINELLHPKVEPELAFIMKADLCSENVSVAEVLLATEYVAPAFEVIDSRFHDFKIGSRNDAVIDNVSSARFKLGKCRKSPRDLDLYHMGVKMKVNNEYTGFGAGASVLGHPAQAVQALVKSLAQDGLGIHAGDIILSGAISTSIPVKLGDVCRADFGGLGYVTMKII